MNASYCNPIIFFIIYCQGPKSTAQLSSLKGAPSLGGSGLGSLKDAPPLTGASKPLSNIDRNKSPDWRDLADIDSKINKLGFGE